MPYLKLCVDRSEWELKLFNNSHAYFQNIVSPESGGIYGDINSSLLWTQPVIEKIDGEFEKALASIEKYKTSDPAMFTKLSNRIMKECLSPIYIKLTILSTYYTETEIAQLRAEFKHYANLFKLAESQEGADFGDLLN